MKIQGDETGRVSSIIKIIRIKFMLASLQEEELFYWGREVIREGQLWHTQANTYGKIKITLCLWLWQSLSSTKSTDIQKIKVSTDTQTAVLQTLHFAILATSHLHGLRTTGCESASNNQKITLHENLYRSSYYIAPVLNTAHMAFNYIFIQEWFTYFHPSNKTPGQFFYAGGVDFSQTCTHPCK